MTDSAEERFMAVERAYLRLAQASNPGQLTDFCAKYLPFLLECLVVETEESCRAKLLEILAHLKRRLHANEDVVLPVRFLLDQYSKENASVFIKNFSYLFLKIGYLRLPVHERFELFPDVLTAMEQKAHEQQLGIFGQLLHVIWSYYYKESAKNTNTRQPLIDCTKTTVSQGLRTKYLNYLAEVVLLRENSLNSIDASAEEMNPSMAGTRDGPVSEAVFKSLLSDTKFPPLSFLLQTNDNVASGSGLAEAKIAIIRFLGDLRLPSEDVAWIWALASADSNHNVASAAEMEMKRAVGRCLDDPGSIAKLYEFYLGTEKNMSIPSTERRRGVNLRVKLKLITYILRYVSTAAAIFPQSIQVLFESWFGQEVNEKLRLRATEFSVEVVAKLPAKLAAVLGPILYSNVRRLVNEAQDLNLLRFCYLVLGKLGKLHSLSLKSVKGRDEFVQEFFDNLISTEDDDVSDAIQSCLLDFVDGFSSSLSDRERTQLQALVLTYAEHNKASCRLAAVRTVERLGVAGHAACRYTLYLMLSDSNDKVRHEAQRILPKGTDGDVESFEYFSQFMLDKVEETLEHLKSHAQFSGPRKPQHSLTPESFKRIIVDVRAQLVKYARIGYAKMETDDSHKFEDCGDEIDDKAVLFTHLATDANALQCKSYLRILVLFMENYDCKDRDLVSFLLELTTLTSETFYVQQVLPCLETIRKQILDSLNVVKDEKTTYMLAEIMARMISSTESRESIENRLKDAVEHLRKDETLNIVQIQVASFLHTMNTSNVNVGNRQNAWEDYLRLLIERFNQSINDLHMLNVEVTVNGLNVEAKFGAFNRMDDGDLRLTLQERLVQAIHSRKDALTTRHKQNCVDFLACWLIRDPGLLTWCDIAKSLMKTAEEGAPNLALQSNIGKALARCVVSPVTSGDVHRDASFISEFEYRRQLLKRLNTNDSKVAECASRLQWLIDECLRDDVDKLKTNKNYKQAMCLWIYSLLQLCNSSLVIQQHLHRLQGFLVSQLAEDDSFTRDVAGRSLSLIFLGASTEQKDLLTKSLRERLTATQAKESLLPFQELSALAVHCKKPELVYDLMTLALHIKRGNRSVEEMQFSRSAQSSVERAYRALKPYNHQLIPSFYRLSFDPDPRVMRIFQNIWTTIQDELTKEDEEKTDVKSTSLLGLHAKETFDELLYQLESGNWRYREASCTALSDLFNGAFVGAVNLEKLGELWRRVLRVLDDMKDSVAVAALRLTQSLSKLTIRVCSANGSPSVTLPQVFPALIEFGLQSNAVASKLMSMVTLNSLIKETPMELQKPYLAVLIISFLEALSTTEKQTVGYLATRSTGDELEAIDQARVAASKDSSMMSTVELCCRHVDESVLRSLTPQLTQLLQTNVGVATKAGACRVMVLLRTHAQQDMRQFADTFVKSLTFCLSDRNITIRKQSATAIGHLAALCSSAALKQLFTKIQQWYLDPENRSMEVSCCYALRALANHSPERMKEFGNIVAPIAFLASQSEQAPEAADTEDLKAYWEEVLAEVTLSAHLWNICDFCINQLQDTQSWQIKAVSAKSIGVLVKKMNDVIPYEKLEKVIFMLMAALEGRTWAGKEYVLISLADAAVKYSALLTDNMPEVEKDRLQNLLLKECQKSSNLSYRKEAILRTGLIAEALSLPIWSRLLDMLNHYLEERVDDDESFDFNCRMVSFTALVRSIDQKSSDAERLKTFGHLLLESLAKSTWQEQGAILNAIILMQNKKLKPCPLDFCSTVKAVSVVLEQARQAALKDSCLKILRECFGSGAANQLTDILPSDVTERLCNSDYLRENDSDLYNQLKKSSV